MNTSCIEEVTTLPEYYPDDKMDELPDEKEIKLTRSELLKITGYCIRFLKKKATAGRFTDQDLERMRDSKMRLLLDACKAHGALLKDEETGEIEKRLADIEQVMRVRCTE